MDTATVGPHPVSDDTEPHAQCWRGADLLKLALNDLARLGYHQTAIDTWRHDSTQHNVRHSYTGGRWNLVCWHDEQNIVGNVSWPDHTSMRRVARLLRGMLPTALAAGQHWPGDDSPLR